MQNKQLFFTLILATVSNFAGAVELDLGVGMTHFEGKDGLWYDRAFDHTVTWNRPSAEIGVTENAWSSQDKSYGLDFRQAYVYLGSMKINAAIPTYDTNVTTGKWVGPDFVGANTSRPCFGKCTHMSEFDGSGHDQGLSLTAQPYYIVGDYKISLIGGLFVHMARWSEQITGIQNGVGTPIYNLNVTNEQTGIALGETAGIAIKKGNFAIKYQYYRTPFHAADPMGHDAFMPPWRGTHNVTLNWTFK